MYNNYLNCDLLVVVIIVVLGVGVVIFFVICRG